MSCTRKLGDRIGMEHLFARLIELAPVAHLRHAAREFSAGLCGNTDLFHIPGGLLGRDCVEISSTRIRGQLYRFGRSLQFRLLKALPLNAAANRQGKQAGQIEHDTAVDFDVIAAPHTAKRKARITHASGLHQIGLGHAELCQRSLQAPVVHQCYLHGGIDAQIAGQQLLERCFNSREVTGGLSLHSLACTLHGRR